MYAESITAPPSTYDEQRQSRRYSAISTTPTPSRAANDTWQHRAVAEYEQSVRNRSARFQQDMAARLATLTGRTLSLSSIYVDEAAQLAVVNLDGIVFQLRDHLLTVVRPCVTCGTGHYNSSPIGTRADLGYALDGWQPHCPHCVPTDSATWIDEL